MSLLAWICFPKLRVRSFKDKRLTFQDELRGAAVINGASVGVSNQRGAAGDRRSAAKNR